MAVVLPAAPNAAAPPVDCAVDDDDDIDLGACCWGFWVDVEAR